VITENGAAYQQSPDHSGQLPGGAEQRQLGRARRLLVNSFAIVIPSVVIPLVLAALAAYAFAWIEFPFRNVLFVAVFALQIVPSR